MGDDAPPGVPEWVVTYGDMMSLLLTFFIMLVSLSEVKASKKFRAVLESLHRQVGYMSGPIAPPGDQFPLNSDTSMLETLGSPLNSKARGGMKARATAPGEDARSYVTAAGRPAKVGQTIEFSPKVASLSGSAKATVRQVAEQLVGKPNKVEVVAFLPDDFALHPESMELAYARARGVYEQLLADGVERQRCRIVIQNPHHATDARDPLISRHDLVEFNLLDAFHQDYVGPREHRTSSK